MRTVYVCPDCGGENVQLLCWVYPNQDKIEVFDIPEYRDVLYCDDCETGHNSFEIENRDKPVEFYLKNLEE